MIKQNIKWLLLSAFIMLALPFCAVTFVNPRIGMFITMLLVFIVNPVFSLCTGCFAGKHFRSRWFQPIVASVLFLLGAWQFFAPGERSFLLYAACYLVFGYVPPVISFCRTRKHRE